MLDINKNPRHLKTVWDWNLAEGVGFEPTIRNYRIPDFESGAFDLSATLPRQERRRIVSALTRKSKAADRETQTPDG